MPTPFIPSELAAATGSYSVQNRLDQGGSLATWLVVKSAKNAQFRTFDGGATADVTVQLDRATLPALSASISLANASTATGSF